MVSEVVGTAAGPEAASSRPLAGRRAEVPMTGVKARAAGQG
jgi:hypothetical protein